MPLTRPRPDVRRPPAGRRGWLAGEPFDFRRPPPQHRRLRAGVALAAALLVGVAVTASWLSPGLDRLVLGGVRTATTAAQLPTTTSVSSSVNPSFLGQPVTFTATVTAQAPPTTSTSSSTGTSLTLGSSVPAPGAGQPTGVSTGPIMLASAVVPLAAGTGGTVAFSADGTTIAGCGRQPLTLNGYLEQASCTTSRLTVGTHRITAAYSGDATDGPSSGSLSQMVRGPLPEISTTTTVTSSVNPSTLGQAVTFTATVAAVATQPAVAGQSAVPTQPAAAGQPAATRSQALATPAAASVQAAGAIGGTVAFSADGTTIRGCGAQPVSLSGNQEQATCTTAGLPVGTHTITATYSGDTTHGGSSGSLTQVVQAPVVVPTTTTVTSSLNPSVQGQAVTFTATVAAAPSQGLGAATQGQGAATQGQGVPGQAGPAAVPLAAPAFGGTVTFSDGESPIKGCVNRPLVPVGNRHQAFCTTATLAVGTHTIFAAYSGDATHDPSSGRLVQRVVQPQPPPTTTPATVPATTTTVPRTTTTVPPTTTTVPPTTTTVPRTTTTVPPTTTTVPPTTTTVPPTTTTAPRTTTTVPRTTTTAAPTTTVRSRVIAAGAIQLQLSTLYPTPAGPTPGAAGAGNSSPAIPPSVAATATASTAGGTGSSATKTGAGASGTHSGGPGAGQGPSAGHGGPGAGSGPRSGSGPGSGSGSGPGSGQGTSAGAALPGSVPTTAPATKANAGRWWLLVPILGLLAALALIVLRAKGARAPSLPRPGGLLRRARPPS